jgi:hypothetical protein
VADAVIEAEIFASRNAVFEVYAPLKEKCYQTIHTKRMDIRIAVQDVSYQSVEVGISLKTVNTAMEGFRLGESSGCRENLSLYGSNP